jgi:hypothetical protein
MWNAKMNNCEGFRKASLENVIRIGSVVRVVVQLIKH